MATNGSGKLPVWLIVVAVIFWPVTLIYLLWTKTKMRQEIKIGGTIVIALLTIVICIAAFNSNPDIPTATGVSSTTSSSTSSIVSSITSSNTSAISSEISSITEVSSADASSKITVSSTIPVKSQAPAQSTPVKVVSSSADVISQTPDAAIKLLNITSPVSTNATATVSVKGLPNTNYTISVYYTSGASKAAGLEAKTSDTDGNVSWNWKIGGSTKPGTYSLTISGGGKSLDVNFDVN